MNSAAVIGRQLRHHAPRASGQGIPPGIAGQLKGRQRQPSHLPGLQPGPGRPFSPGGFNQQPKTGYYQREFYPHPAHRESADKYKRDKQQDKNKEQQPKLRCTWHCFCVAMKALSGGIILLTIGTIMSVVGFFAEPLAIEYKKAPNGTLVPTIDPDIKTHLHNLTYVGPVIMGLGGIVVVAACVLTFEVRDTLGVKEMPNKPQLESSTVNLNLNSINDKNDKPKDSLRKKSLTTSSHQNDNSMGKGRKQLSLPLATISDLKKSLELADDSKKNGNNQQSKHQSETSFCEIPLTSSQEILANKSKDQSNNQRKSSSRPSSAITISSSASNYDVTHKQVRK